MVTKKKAFGGYHIVPDEHLAKIIGKGKVSPSEMTKKLWAYVKAKKLARH
jgi:chromatin remodeling complex protein RSC6